MTLTACGGGAQSPTGPEASLSDANRTAHLRVGFTIPTPALNPHKMVSGTAAYPYLTLVYDRLTQMVDRDGRLELAPMVATGWEFAPDGKSVTFQLRDGITFTDGAALDAEAVKATLDHAKTPGSTVASYFTMIDSVDVIDPTHVRVRANRPAADLPYVLSSVEASLVSPRALDNPDLDVKPVGSGPYIATEVRIGDSATYNRRDGYWDPNAQSSETITIKGFPDDNARLNALRSGQVDIVNTKVGQYAQASKLGNGFGFFSYPPSQVYAILLNTDRGALANPKVRQALNFAVDREGINKSLLNGQCAPTAQTLTEPMNGYLADPPTAYTYDPDRARALLAESGDSNVTVTAVVGAGLSPQGEIASALKAQMADVGVTFDIKTTDIVDGLARFAQKSEDAMVHVRVADSQPAASLMRNFVNPRQFPGTPVPQIPESLAPVYDPAITEGLRTTALQTASAVINEQALDVPICAVSTQFAFNDNVIGANSMGVAHYAGVPDLRYVGLTR
ncbi:ABC transporter substrate-binding protein [Rhodococcus koreensis]